MSLKLRQHSLSSTLSKVHCFSDKVKTHVRVKQPYLTQCHMQVTPQPPSPSSSAIYPIFFLYDDMVTNTEDKIIALLKVAGVNAEPFGPDLFAKSTLESSPAIRSWWICPRKYSAHPCCCCSLGENTGSAIMIQMLVLQSTGLMVNCSKQKLGVFRENLEANEREDMEERYVRCLVVFCSLAMMRIY